MALTQAEKQAAYRARQKVTPDGNGNAVTVTNETVTRKPDVTMVEQCISRAKRGQSYRKGDPAWPYTRHVTPPDFIAWCREHKPDWLTPHKPGDPEYGPTGNNVCQCGKDTGHKLVVKCLACCTERVA